MEIRQIVGMDRRPTFLPIADIARRTKFTSPADPAARWTAVSRGPAVIAYPDNYLIDLKCAVVIDVLLAN